MGPSEQCWPAAVAALRERSDVLVWVSPRRCNELSRVAREARRWAGRGCHKTSKVLATHPELRPAFVPNRAGRRVGCSFHSSRVREEEKLHVGFQNTTSCFAFAVPLDPKEYRSARSEKKMHDPWTCAREPNVREGSTSGLFVGNDCYAL